MLFVALLGVMGLSVESKLVPVSPTMPGSESAQAEQLIDRHFGNSAPFTVVLRGPPGHVETQGKRLVEQVERQFPEATVLAPWGARAFPALSPAPERAILLLDLHHPVASAVEEDVPVVDSLVSEHIAPPVSAVTSSYPAFLRGVKEASDDAAKQAETVVVPVLLLVLLIVFRSPIAAIFPLVLGGLTVVSARGLLAIGSSWANIDAFAIPVSGMIGLALGVDYSLLMVARFREELDRGLTPREAARQTRSTAGRTVLGAGGTLFLALAVVLLFVPGPLFQSVIGSMILVTALSVLFAWVVAPAGLALLGPRLNQWRLGSPSERRPVWMGVVRRALRVPVAATIAICGVLILFAVPTIALDIGPSGLDQLPSDSQVKRDADLVDEIAGPGWSAPFVVVASSDGPPVTEDRTLRALTRMQREIGSRTDVRLVIGPADVSSGAASTTELAQELFGRPAEKRLARSSAMASSLSRAAQGVSRLRAGLSSAADGAGLLEDGSVRAGEGASQISGGLERARQGVDVGAIATERLASGAERLVDGQRSLRFGALTMKLGLEDLESIFGSEQIDRARELERNLESAAADDPSLQASVELAHGIVFELEKGTAETTRLSRVASKIHSGLGKSSEGSERIADGASRLAEGSSGLGKGLRRLADGSEALTEGLNHLSYGAGALQSNLDDGAVGSAPLEQRLGEGGETAQRESDRLRTRLDLLKQRSPRLFDSGHFLLSALDGTPSAQRSSIDQTIDLDSGQAARMVVVADSPLNSPGSRELYQALRERADRLEDEVNVTAGVAGGEPQLADFADVAEDRFPFAILVISVATFLILIVILRAIVLAAITVLLNLLSVGVAFGVLALIALIPEGYPLGGHSVIDVTGVTAVFTVAFGLSIDYSVFVLMRIRESYQEGGDPRTAIEGGVEKSGRVISGAAAVMAVVFLAFGAVPVVFLSQMGIGLAVAVLVDSTLVRLILLPSIMVLLGDRAWWLPPGLERILPSRPAPL